MEASMHEKPGSGTRFPIRMLTIALLLTGATFVWLAHYVYDSYGTIERTREQYVRTEQLRGIIVHLDEVLTMSARMAAATGDMSWEERYREAEPELDAAIKEAMGIAPQSLSAKSVALTDAANSKLVAMENEAFDQARQGNTNEALALLSSRQYHAQKRVYADGMERFTERLEEELDATLLREEHRATWALVFALVAFLVLTGAWFIVIRSLRRWHSDLVVNVAHREHAVEEELRAKRAFKMLAECSRALARAEHESEVLEEVCRLIVHTGGYRTAWVGFAEHDQDKSIRLVAQEGHTAGVLDTVRLTWADTELGRGPAGTAVRSGMPCIGRESLTDSDPGLRDDSSGPDRRTPSISLPLLADDQTLGVLHINGRDSTVFDAQEVSLLRELADDLAYGIVTLRGHGMNGAPAAGTPAVTEDSADA